MVVDFGAVFMFHGLLWDVLEILFCLLQSYVVYAFLQDAFNVLLLFPKLKILLFVPNGSLRWVYSVAARVHRPRSHILGIFFLALYPFFSCRFFACLIVFCNIASRSCTRPLFSCICVLFRFAFL